MIHITTITSATVLGLACSQIVIQVFSNSEISQEVISASISPYPSSANHHFLNYADIQKWNLFGQPVNEANLEIDKIETTHAPESRLKLVLQGTVYSDTDIGGFAIISEPGSLQKTYHLGDSLPGGATLYAVKPAHVILRRNGRYETLTLRKKTGIQIFSRETSQKSSSSSKPALLKTSQDSM